MARFGTYNKIPTLLISFILGLIVTYSGAAAESLSSGEDAKNFILRHTFENEVVVFSKSYCPYCRATKDLLNTIKGTEIDFSLKVVELDLQEKNDGSIIQKELLDLTGQTTVPNIFIGGQHLGGNSDIQAMASAGVLEEILDNIERSTDL